MTSALPVNLRSKLGEVRRLTDAERDRLQLMFCYDVLSFAANEHDAGELELWAALCEVHAAAVPYQEGGQTKRPVSPDVALRYFRSIGGWQKKGARW